MVRLCEFGALRIIFALGWLFNNGSAFLSGTSVVRLCEFGALWILCTLGWLFKMDLFFFLVHQWYCTTFYCTCWVMMDVLVEFILPAVVLLFLGVSWWAV